MTQTFIIGQVGRLIERRGSGNFKAKSDDDRTFYKYVGPCGTGAHAKHVFQSVRGGYLRSINAVDFAIGAVRFAADGRQPRESSKLHTAALSEFLKHFARDRKVV